MAYPENDEQFQDCTVQSVSEDGSFQRNDGWSFCMPEGQHARVGQAARFYGKGLGHVVRGLFLDGTKVFYRTEEEDRQCFIVEHYGKDASEWLTRWDEGKTVLSAEMGGLGPGYEQVIQITAAEILRYLLAGGSNDVDDIHAWSLEQPMLQDIGLSGAQFGGACNLARQLFCHGPKCLADLPSDRRISVCRDFPGMVRKEYPT